MNKLRFILAIFVFLIYNSSLLFGQEEELEIITYYPAPYGNYNELHANTYRDRNDTQYFLNLDGLSRIYTLNIGVAPSNTVTRSELQIGDTFSLFSFDDAVIYAKTIRLNRADIQDVLESGTIDDYAAIYGETVNEETDERAYGVYGYAHSSRATNIGVYGRATGSSSFDYGVEGRGDTCGVVGGLAKVGIAGIFGRDTATELPGFNCALYGLGQDITVDEETLKAHGIYGRVLANNAEAGLFGAAVGSGRGVYAHSINIVVDEIEIMAHDGIRAYAGNTGYGGQFHSDYSGIYLENEQSSSSYAEITCGDDELSILTGDSGDENEARFTVMGPYNKNSLLRVRAFTSAGTERRYIELFCNDDSTRGYIRADRAIQIEPGTILTATPEDKRVTIMGTVYWRNPAAEVYDPWHTDPDHSYADLAEPFELVDKEALGLGDVVEVDRESGYLKKTTTAYAKTAGIISSIDKAAMVIGYRKDGTNDKPLALTGKVKCKADAAYGGIRPGDLLVSSPTPGYAMKAVPVKEVNGQKIYGQGVIIGKALETLKEGRGKILVLVTR